MSCAEQAEDEYKYKTVREKERERERGGRITWSAPAARLSYNTYVFFKKCMKKEMENRVFLRSGTQRKNVKILKIIKSLSSIIHLFSVHDQGSIYVLIKKAHQCLTRGKIGFF